MINDKGKIYYGLGLDNAQLRADAAEARSVIKGIGDTTVSEGNRIDGSMRKIGVAVMGAFSVQQAAQFAKSVVDVRGEIEALEKSFVVLAGHKGIPLFNEIRAFATDTTFQLGDLAKGAQTLLAFNIEADRVMPILRQIGDISMGNVDKFNSLILAFAQMSSTGKLMGQDLLQMINAGFNPLTVISDKTGKSIAQLKKEMEQGGITSDMVADAFESATAAGGKFNGMLEDQSKGIKGLKSNLEGAWEEALNSIGEKNEEVIKGSIQGVTLLVQNYEKVGRVIAELIGVYGVYKAALITLNAVEAVQIQLTSGWTLAELAHYKALVLVEKAQKLLNATILKNPYVAVAAAVAALAYGLYKYFEVENQAKKAAEDHKTAIDTLNQKYGEEQNRIDSLINTIRDETTARVDRIVAMNELKGLYPNIFDKYIDEKGHIRDLIGLQRELNEAQANRRMAEEGDILTDYERKLRDYKQLQKATANGWSWASAGTYNNVNDLTEDWSFWQSKDSFLAEKVAYWEQMVAKQRKVVDENNYTRFVSSLADKTDEELERLRQLYDKTGELTATETRRLEAINSEISSRKPAAVVENKAYWEDYVKQQQKMLDNMTEAQLKTEEAARIRANITKGQKKIDAYKVNGNKEETEAQRIQRETAERNEQIQQYGEAVSREVRQAELDIAQSKIDAMEEGFAKQQAQIKLTYDRMIFENQQRQQEWVEALRDSKELEWQNANPNYKKEGKTFDRSTVTAADLTPEQKAQLQAYADFAAAYQRDSNQKLLEDMLADFQTYNQQREKIVEEFEAKRNAMYKDGKKENGLREGVEQGNLDELNRQEQEALTAVDEQFASREATFQAWMNSIANMTLEQLEAVLAQAERELAELEKQNPNDPKLAQARAKVATARQKVTDKKAENDVSPNKRSIEEWNDLRDALNDVAGEFDTIGDAVGGVAGEIISTAGTVLTGTVGMINGIVQLVQMSATSMTATATAGATAIGMIEKASVILAVISAALQIATAIAGLFNNDKEHQEEIEALQGRIDQLQWELDNADTVRLQNTTGDILEKVKKTYAETTQAVLRQHAVSKEYYNAMYRYFGEAIYQNEIMTKTVNELAKGYANVAYSADKALGEAKYDEAKDQLKNIAEQQLLIQKQIDEENAKKDTDEGAIKEYEKKIAELGQEAVNIINEIVEDIIGGSAADIAEELGDAFVEAFQNGEDAAEAWGNKVKDIVADVIKRMLVSKYLEEPLGAIFDKYKAQWYKDGEFAGVDAVIASMSGFAGDLNAVGEEFALIWESLPDSVKNMFTVTGDAAREASEKGIATASQESVDELNGRATAIQSHTYTIAECQKLLVETTMQLLEAVWGIQRNTDRLEAIEGDMRSVKNTVNDIALKGIKLK